MDIQFEFEGQRYTAPASFYDTNRFTLPDGRTIAAKAWFETMPPRPNGLHVVADEPSAERTPEVVLRAMLRAYEAAALDAKVASIRAPSDRWLIAAAEQLIHDVNDMRVATALVIASAAKHPVSWLGARVYADYAARLAGSTPLDAPPPVVP